MSKFNEEALEQRLAKLEGARAWSPRVVSRLESLIRSGEDSALFRVNPLKFAHERSIAESEAIDLLLHATSVGLFTMDWMVICPMCSSIVESFGSLRTINTNHYLCHFCQTEYEAALDDYIVVSFTIARAIRCISFHDPDGLPVQDYLQHVAYSLPQLRGEVPDGMPGLSPMQIFQHCVKGFGFLAPRETQKIEFSAGRTIVEGKAAIKVCEVVSGKPLLLRVEAASINEHQHRIAEFAHGGWSCFDEPLNSGLVSLEFRNNTDRRILFTVAEFPEGIPHCSTKLIFEPHLSAKRLLTTQSFRDLFRAELIKGTEGIGVRDITLVFTDLKGSTALYERIGDLNALALVQQHFARLTDVAVRHNGSIIKTLGDAVMAAFLTPLDAVKAALSMRAEIDHFNDERPRRDFILKIGMHRGAAIAVTFNERLDYFGQTVNIAARVQGLADGNEIYLTQEVYETEGVKSVLEPYEPSVASAQLKGVQQQLPVWRIGRCEIKAAAIA